MVANFKLSERLRLFVQVAANYKSLTLGDKLPLSIRKQYSWSQTIVIYPESDYDFFTGREVMRILSLAESLNLDSAMSTENGVPVIEITDYSINDK